MVKTTRSPAASTEYDTMPCPPSRARSRRARSAAGTSSASALGSNSRGSASRISSCVPVAVSNVLSHRDVTLSSGPSERRNNAREPSPITVAERGAPQVNRRVRALCSGNCSMADWMVAAAADVVAGVVTVDAVIADVSAEGLSPAARSGLPLTEPMVCV